jgi:hypothetical protein
MKIYFLFHKPDNSIVIIRLFSYLLFILYAGIYLVPWLGPNRPPSHLRIVQPHFPPAANLLAKHLSFCPVAS